jgi:predicted dehydrogenase
MQSPVSRRTFVSRISLAGAALAATGFQPILRAAASSRVRVAVMGCNGRGMDHIAGYLAVPNVEIAYIADVDSRALEKGIAMVAKKQGTKPIGVTDFRKALEDPNVDALSIAAPNHWHAPAAILACAAGKHVYVEKPCSQTAHEGELLLAAARKYRRQVQMGNQRRSWPWMREAIQRLHAGEIGEVYFARTWYNNSRPTIGTGKPAPVPSWLDYSLWQGPAPERAFVDNVVHYNWHWRWHWGSGELGNNGVHMLDIARWGLQVDYPTKVTTTGGRYHFKDDQETPDTAITTYDFGTKAASWEGHSCDPYGFEKSAVGVIFYGKEGTMIMAGSGCRIVDPKGMPMRTIDSKTSDTDHFANFVDSIRADAKLTSPIEEGVKSTLLCHLGNIAYRTSQVLNVDASTGRVKGNSETKKLWTREYRKGWEPKV